MYEVEAMIPTHHMRFALQTLTIDIRSLRKDVTDPARCMTGEN